MSQDNMIAATASNSTTNRHNEIDLKVEPEESSNATPADNIAPEAKPNNQNDSIEDDALLERMRGDAVGNTMYSRKFILQTLVKLTQQASCLDEELDADLCKLWDMSVSPEVVTVLYENEAIELFVYVLTCSDDVRLYEIIVGLLANMCAQVECVQQLTHNASWIEVLLKLGSCMDMCMLLQLMRLYQYIMSHVKTGKEQLAIDWYTCFTAFEDSVRNLGFMLQQSVNNELLAAGLKAVNALLAGFSLIEEEQANNANTKLKPFAEVFLLPELINGVNEAFGQLMSSEPQKQLEASADENSCDSDSEQQKIDAEYDVHASDTAAIQTYLNICSILAQLPCTDAAMELYAPGVMACLTSVLQFLQQPMQLLPLSACQQDILEDITHICSCLQYFYDSNMFVNLLAIWVQLQQHVHNYTAETANDLDADYTDAPLAEYISRAFKLLELLAHMLLKADAKAVVPSIGAADLEMFRLALNEKHDLLFQQAGERLRDLTTTHTND